MTEPGDEGRARERAAVVFAVRSGRITAEEGARRLGVSRKTYYQWERRALAAVTEALEDRAAGRPGVSRDHEKERLQEQITELEKKLFVAQKTVEVRDMLHAYELHNSSKKPGEHEKKPKRKKRP